MSVLNWMLSLCSNYTVCLVMFLVLVWWNPWDQSWKREWRFQIISPPDHNAPKCNWSSSGLHEHWRRVLSKIYADDFVLCPLNYKSCQVWVAEIVSYVPYPRMFQTAGWTCWWMCQCWRSHRSWSSYFGFLQYSVSPTAFLKMVFDIWNKTNGV